MQISVIGSGYVGLVAAAGFAESGNDVYCMDIDEAKVERLRKGEVPIYEPGLEELVAFNQREGRLRFGTSLEEAARASDVIFLALPTPPLPDGSADLNAVLEVTRGLAARIDRFKVIVTKSTVPVGTADRLTEILLAGGAKEFEVVSNPEFLKEGSAVNDFMKPDRVVVGARTKRAADIMQELYGPFLRTGKPFLVMDTRSAELTKYAANAFLATKISFINEIANLCDTVGADVESVRIGMGTDERIGLSFLFPGIGYGGSCFPKDTNALIQTSREHGYEFGVLGAVATANARQKEILCAKVKKHFGGDLRGKVVAVWGLAFKPRTDDVREAPAIDLIRALAEAGARVRAYDPKAIAPARQLLAGVGVEFVDTNYGAIEGADALCIATEWNEFRRPDYEKMKQLMRTPVVFDGRNIFDPAKMKERGFIYYGIGRR